MTTIDKSKPVIITGGTGYVAGWIVKELLDHGITVHAPVRNSNDKEKIKYLQQLADQNHGTIKFFEADLLKPGSYDKAMEGCELVFHTASPFINKVNDPQHDLLDPAVKGTQNILESVNRTESVKRVVLTSSVAAIYGDAKDMLALPNGIATEEHWNTTSTLQHQPYSYSKVLAEKEAWKMNEAQSRWDLVVINPSLVIGPGVNPFGTSESFNIVKQIGDGTTKFGAPALDFGMVDVRDLAVAHYRAGFKAEAKGRHIISNQRMSLLDLGKILQKHFGNKYPFPKKELPKFLIWLMAPMIGVKRKMIANNVGYLFKVDNSKSKHELNMQYRPIEVSIVDFFQQMIDNGVFKK